jgi:hypothetical protein
MAFMLETPARVMKRIQAGERMELPSLPSLPEFEDSAATSESVEDDDFDLSNESFDPVQSTPSATASAATAIRIPGSAARFANSIAGRSTRSGNRSGFSSASQLGKGQREQTTHLSFDDISRIPSQPDGGGYQTPSLEDDNESVMEALEAVSSRPASPTPEPAALVDDTPRKKSYDYSMSLRTESKARNIKH